MKVSESLDKSPSANRITVHSARMQLTSRDNMFFEVCICIRAKSLGLLLRLPELPVLAAHYKDFVAGIAKTRGSPDIPEAQLSTD